MPGDIKLTDTGAVVEGELIADALAVTTLYFKVTVDGKTTYQQLDGARWQSLLALITQIPLINAKLDALMASTGTTLPHHGPKIGGAP